jgi:predicted amidohydrolase YtcJ
MQIRLLVAMLIALASGAHAEKVVLRRAAIYTLDRARPWATALVLEGGRIAYVGDDEGARSFAGPGARSIDLAGRMVLPGFHDSHLHPMSGAMRLLRCRLGDRKTADEIYTAVHMCAAALKKDAWLLATGAAPELFAKGVLTRRKLDELVPDRPALITTEEGFTAWVNTRALEAAGLDPEKSDGVLKNDAMDPVRSRVPRPTEAEYREALRRSTAIANGFGITSMMDARATPPLLEAYRAADRAGELTVRMVAAQAVDPARGEAQIAELIAQREKSRGKRLRADACKLFLDVEIDQHNAALLEPYADAPQTRGELLIQPALLDALVRRLDAENFLIHMHAMGDRAVRAGLDSIEAAIRANGPRDRRHQLAHIGVASPDDFPRFGKLSVAANFQPLWAQASDPVWPLDLVALGPARSKWLLPMGSIAAAGGRIVASSDWPAPTMNPLEAMEVALTRDAPQRLTLSAILAAYTIDAAWAVREDEIDGSIEAGKAADLVVLDRNLFDLDARKLHEARVLLTLLDGEPVYRDPAFAGWGR